MTGRWHLPESMYHSNDSKKRCKKGSCSSFFTPTMTNASQIPKGNTLVNSPVDNRASDCNAVDINIQVLESDPAWEWPNIGRMLTGERNGYVGHRVNNHKIRIRIIRRLLSYPSRP